MTMSRRNQQKGIALFLTLIFVLILSVIGVSIIFVSQSETWSGLNYLEMTQSRYGAEAGLNSAANYIVNTYCAPGNTTCSNGSSPTSGDTLSLYNTNVSPVTLASSGSVVTLSTNSTSATYPVAAVETAFASAAAGSVTDGGRSVTYSATATLMAMNQVTTAAGNQTVQTWSITGTGTTGNIRGSTVQVTGTVEQQVTFAASSTPSYGVFGTGNGCGDLSFSGGITIGSYDSKNPTLSGGHWTTDHWGGDIGSNGNLNESGGATVYGSLSTPRTGVGSCSSGGVDAWSDSGGATVTGCQTASACVTGGLVQLSQAVSYATPTMPTAPSSWTTSNLSITSTSTCANTTGLSSSNCSGTAGNLTLTPGTNYGKLSLSGGAKVTLTAGTYNIDTISVSGGASLTLNSTTAASTINTNSINLSGGTSMTLNNADAVTMNVYGTAGVTLSGGTALVLSSTAANPGVVTLNVASTSTSPWNGSGGTFSNLNSSSVPTPAIFQINYGGTSTVTVSGGAGAAAALYAPNAPINLSGGTTWYGSLIGSKVTDSGGASIYYDRELGSTTTSSQIATVGNFMMDSFSWTRF